MAIVGGPPTFVPVRRRRWRRVTYHAFRVCSDCKALVADGEGQQAHQEWHDWLLRELAAIKNLGERTIDYAIPEDDCSPGYDPGSPDDDLEEDGTSRYGHESLSRWQRFRTRVL